MKAAEEHPGVSSPIRAGMTNPRLEAHYRGIRVDSARPAVLARRRIDLLHLSRQIYCMFSRASGDHTWPIEASFAPGNLSYINRCENWTGHARKEPRQ